jgi:ABC-type multidrug transport system fused ATPase/permease subunit
MVISVFFFRRVEKAYEAYQTQEARALQHLQENLSGVRVVKAFARQEYEENKFDGREQRKVRARALSAADARALLADHRHSVRGADAGRLSPSPGG